MLKNKKFSAHFSAASEHRKIFFFLLRNAVSSLDFLRRFLREISAPQTVSKIWSALDMKNGYHQVPLKREDRHITCMSTLRGTKQWTVLAMGLKKRSYHFPKHDGVGPEGSPRCIDDVIVGSMGNTPEE